jgi:hypothetical protein
MIENAHFATQLNKAKIFNKVVGPFGTDGRYMIDVLGSEFRPKHSRLEQAIKWLRKPFSYVHFIS